MLDEFGTELENTDSKLDSTMKKVAKVLRMSNGRSWFLSKFLKYGIEIIFFQIDVNGQRL